jgi:hypothetical protein
MNRDGLPTRDLLFTREGGCPASVATSGMTLGPGTPAPAGSKPGSLASARSTGESQ